MKSFIYVKIRFIGVLFLLILFNSITVFAAGNEEYFRSVFDPDYYYNQYPDLQGQLGNDSEALFHHFMTIGVREGRSGNAEFNLRAYVLHNRDLLDYYKTDLSAYCKHYMEIGKAEGRTCLPTGDEQGLIGTYSTHYDTTVPRAVNIGIAVERLNGTVIQPGQLFSYSQTLLPRIPENGYVMAPAIGRYEYGGGICQVSSTLYAAMCDALLPVIERYPHSSHVSYIPVGMDATISEAGGKDLKFINIGQDPLKIVAETNEGTITVYYLFSVKRDAGNSDVVAVTDNDSWEEWSGKIYPADPAYYNFTIKGASKEKYKIVDDVMTTYQFINVDGEWYYDVNADGEIDEAEMDKRDIESSYYYPEIIFLGDGRVAMQMEITLNYTEEDDVNTYYGWPAKGSLAINIFYTRK